MVSGCSHVNHSLPSARVEKTGVMATWSTSSAVQSQIALRSSICDGAGDDWQEWQATLDHDVDGPFGDMVSQV